MAQVPDYTFDEARLDALAAFGILDTPPEEGFDTIVELATQLCACPVALVSLVDRDRQWFKARVNFPPCETDLNSSVCAHALTQPDRILVIPDLTADPRTRANPLVTGEPHIRFYAGAPLVTPEGQVLGSLCVIDKAPRSKGLSAAQASGLKGLARQVMAQLELRRALARRDALVAEQQAGIRERDILIATQAAIGAAKSDLDAVLSALVQGARRAVPAAEGAVLELIDGDELEYRAVEGSLEAFKGDRVPLRSSVAGECARLNAPILVSDLLKDGRTCQELVTRLSLRSAIFAPVTRGGEVLGVLKLQSSQPAAFTAHDLQVIQLFAGAASAGLTEAWAAAAQREAAAVLAVSLDNLRQAEEAGGVGLFTLTIADNVIEPTPEFCRLYGLEVQDSYTAAAVEAQVLPEDRAQMSTAETRSMGTAASAAEYRIRLPGTGDVRWIARTGRIERDADGRPVRFVGAARDITQQRAAQLALAESQQHLQDSERHWRALFERLTEGFIVGEVVRDERGQVTDWRYLDVNEAWGRLVGIDSATVVGRTLREVIPGVEDAWIMDFAQVVDTGNPTQFTRQVGTLRRWYDGRAFKLEGERFGVLFLEVTERIETDARREALLAIGDRLRDLTSVDAMTMAACDTLGTTLGAMLVGYGEVDARAETITVMRDWTVPGVESLAGTLNFRDFGSYIDDLKRGDVVVVTDARTDPRTAAYALALEARSARAFVNTPVFERGVFVGLQYVSTAEARTWTDTELAFIRDVASRLRLALARVQAEAQQALLNGELAHRMKNTMAMVQAIAMQTLRDAHDKAAVTAFTDRIHALAQAHDVLLKQSWASAHIEAVVKAVLGTFGQAERFDTSGPDIKLGATATLSLSLLLHELATNAVKYGSLSADGGWVMVSWRVKQMGDSDELVFNWREVGGPPVRAPARKGFGSRLIQMGLTGSGGVTLSYDETGFRAEMRASYAHVQAS